MKRNNLRDEHSFLYNERYVGIATSKLRRRISRWKNIPASWSDDNARSFRVCKSPDSPNIPLDQQRG